MTAKKETKKTPRVRRPARIALALGLALVLLGAGVAARDLVAGETSQARAFVLDGQQALARNDRAAAALSFERARWLAPRSAFVRSAIATAQIDDAEPPLPRALRLVTAREWSAIATFFGWLAAIGIGFVVVEWERRRALWVALAAGCASVLGMAGVVESNGSAPAIVSSPDTPLLVAPYANAAAERVLPAGTMVLLGSRYQAFVHVRDGGGQSGWVPRGSIKSVAGTEG